MPGAKSIDVDQDLEQRRAAPRRDVDGDRRTARTVVRGGFGIYYDQGFNNISGNISNSARSTNVTVLNPGFPDPYAGGTIAATKPSVTIAAPAIDDAVDAHARASASRRELRPGLAVSVDGVRTLGYDLFNALDINAPLPGSERATRPRLSPHRAVPDDRASWTNALLVSLERRIGPRPAFNVSYTLSDADPQRRGLRLRAAGLVQPGGREGAPPATIAGISSSPPWSGRCRGASRPPDCCRRAAACPGT